MPQEQWLELIGLREPGHPGDVTGPLRDLIEMGIERTSDMECSAMYLDELRQRHHRKTSFIAKLEAAFAMTPD